MTRVTDVVGGRKFASFVASSLGLVALYAFGLELSDSTLDAITTLYLAFVTGNGVEHLALQLGTRRNRPTVDELPGDIIDAVRDAAAEGRS